MGFNKNAKQAGRLQLVQKVLFLMMEVDGPAPFVSGMVGQALKENNVDPEPGDEEGKKDVLKTKLVGARFSPVRFRNEPTHFAWWTSSAPQSTSHTHIRSF